MQMTGNTVLITGGGSGIGRGLAESLHKLGNTVIISGRRKSALADTVAANPGMKSVELDVQDRASVQAAAKTLIQEYPQLNVLINNAGIMRMDQVENVLDDEVMISTVQTNLYGPMRMTSALIEHLKAQPSATVINVTSGLAFVPLAPTAVYCSTKAALHSYTQSLRFKLRETAVRVLELAPPYVQTELLNGKDDPRAMPLAEYIAEVMTLLEGDNDEVLVERVKMLRNAVGPDEGAFVTKFNNMMAGH